MKTTKILAMGAGASVLASLILLSACGPGSAPPNPLPGDASVDAPADGAADAKPDAEEDGGPGDAASSAD